MSAWILVVCTHGWIMCGQFREYEYPTEESCYRAMNSLYEKHGRDAFNYIICRPRTAKDKAP